MAQLAKDQRSSSCSFQGALNSQDGSSFSPLIHFQNLPSLNPSPGFYMFEDDQYHQKQQHLHHHLGLNHTSDSYTEGHHGEMSESQQQVVRNSPDLSSSSSADSSNEFAFSNSAASYHQLDDQVAPSLIHFKTTQGNGGGDGFINGSGGSSISFQQEGVVDYGFVGQEKENYAWWESSIINDYQRQQQQGVNGSGLRVLEGVNNHELPKGSDMMYGEALRSDGEISAKESTNKQQACLKKRAITEEDNIQTPKKQCTSSKKQAISKAKSSSPPTASKDSMQSAAAKNRRERISERLKTLQDLVPNGSKVDMVTMLEKAIGYVKFLQLQVKVLAADEFWPAAGGKAPDISQVREALDAILQRDRNSTSQKATVEGFD